jgi:hypothetical protein
LIGANWKKASMVKQHAHQRKQFVCIKKRHWTNDYKDGEYPFVNGEPDFEKVAEKWEKGAVSPAHNNEETVRENINKDDVPRENPKIDE